MNHSPFAALPFTDSAYDTYNACSSGIREAERVHRLGIYSFTSRGTPYGLTWTLTTSEMLTRKVAVALFIELLLLR